MAATAFWAKMYIPSCSRSEKKSEFCELKNVSFQLVKHLNEQLSMTLRPQPERHCIRELFPPRNPSWIGRFDSAKGCISQAFFFTFFKIELYSIDKVNIHVRHTDTIPRCLCHHSFEYIQMQLSTIRPYNGHFRTEHIDIRMIFHSFCILLWSLSRRYDSI